MDALSATRDKEEMMKKMKYTHRMQRRKYELLDNDVYLPVQWVVCWAAVTAS
jgi:hypothetical protein